MLSVLGGSADHVLPMLPKPSFLRFFTAGWGDPGSARARAGVSVGRRGPPRGGREPPGRGRPAATPVEARAVRR